MMREQDSDSTLPPEEGGRRRQMPSPCQREGMAGPVAYQTETYRGGGVNTSPHEMVCSFCGVANHGHKECPVMHQNI